MEVHLEDYKEKKKKKEKKELKKQKQIIIANYFTGIAIKLENYIYLENQTKSKKIANV